MLCSAAAESDILNTRCHRTTKSPKNKKIKNVHTIKTLPSRQPKFSHKTIRLQNSNSTRTQSTIIYWRHLCAFSLMIYETKVICGMMVRRFR